jgi:hypothetical protein
MVIRLTGLTVVCATLFVTSSVPSAQLVSVTVPAVELIVIVPAALQFQLGDVLKLAPHCVASTLIDGGSSMFVHVTHMPLLQWALLAHA